MRNILIIIAIAFSINTQAQNVSWVPSSETDDGCEMVTDCKTNTLCYSLEYVPEVSGVLTSYTTGFFYSCIDGAANVLHNQSCVINDNSNEISACNELNKTLLSCSGNTGQLVLTKDMPIILHQVCFNIDVYEEVKLEEDAFMGVSMSIDLANHEFVTSRPSLEASVIRTRDDKDPCDEEAVLTTSTTDNVFTKEYVLYPNPSSGNIKVLFNDGGADAILTIVTAENKKLMSQNITCGETYEFDFRSYVPGTYIAQVKGENNTDFKKFIIIK